MKKSIVAIFSVIFVATLITSCSCGGDKSKEKEKEVNLMEKIVGTWEIVDAEGDFADINKGTIYVFGEDKSFTSSLGIFETKGKITKVDSKIITVKLDGYEDEFVYNCKFDGEKMLLDIEGSNQKFTLQKKQ